jgi:hypothetical protein
MTDKGPITFITDLSNKRNRWRGLAFAWRAAAIAAIRPCSTCGAPSLYRHASDDLYWCQAHFDELPKDVSASATKLPWHSSLQRALELEVELEQNL